MKIYIRSSELVESTDYSKFSTVFMLLQKAPDGVFSLGKFYADNLWSAKESLNEAIKTHPGLEDADLYVSKYNSYLDTPENRNDPDGVEKDVFDNISDLMDQYDYNFEYDESDLQ